METLKEEQSVVVCHHCHGKVQVIDICNDGTAGQGMSDDEDMNAVDQIEELAAWVGVGDTKDLQQQALQTTLEINGVHRNLAKEDRQQMTVNSD